MWAVLSGGRLGLLAMREASLRDEAKEMVDSFLREGTTAMKCRARHTKRKLERLSYLVEVQWPTEA